MRIYTQTCLPKSASENQMTRNFHVFSCFFRVRFKNKRFFRKVEKKDLYDIQFSDLFFDRFLTFFKKVKIYEFLTDNFMIFYENKSYLAASLWTESEKTVIF